MPSIAYGQGSIRRLDLQCLLPEQQGDYAWAEWPLSVETVSNRRVSELVATTCQNLAETRQNSRVLKRGSNRTGLFDQGNQLWKWDSSCSGGAGVFYSETTVMRQATQLAHQGRSRSLDHPSIPERSRTATCSQSSNRPDVLERPLTPVANAIGRCAMELRSWNEGWVKASASSLVRKLCCLRSTVSSE